MLPTGERGAVSRRARKVVVVLIALAVGGAHMFTGPGYRGPFRWFVTGYAIDILLPISSYFLLVAAAEDLAWLRPWFVRVLVVVAVMSCAEVSQYLGKPIFGRTYDPWDFVAYAGGALLAAVMDQIVLSRVFEFWRRGKSENR